MTPSDKKPSVPDEVAKLVSAEAFDIDKLRVDSFRDEAHRSAAGALTFTLGKPGGIAQGIAIVTKKTAQVRAKLLIRRLGKATRFALPTPEFVAPELAAYLEPVHLIPAVDVSGPNPAGYVIPFRVTVWDGYETVFNALSKLNDAQQGIWLRYRRGTGNDPGGYDAERFPLDDVQRAIWQTTPWPTPEEALSLIPAPTFDDLLAENFNWRRTWELVRQRQGSAT